MAPRQICGHEKARFQGVQRLGQLEPVELWHCPQCKSTLAAETLRGVSKPVAAGG